MEQVVVNTVSEQPYAPGASPISTGGQAAAVSGEPFLSLAAEWYGLIAEGLDFSYVPPEMACRRLATILELLPGCLQDPADEPSLECAARLGQELATLHLFKPVTLATSQAFLAERLPGLTAAPELVPFDRIMLFLAAFAGGYVEEMQRLILLEQEAVRRASFLSLERARYQLETNHDQLARMNGDLLREINQRHQVEVKLREYAERLENLRAVNLSILSAESLEETVELAVGHVQQTMNCRTAAVVLLDLEAQIFQVVYTNLESGVGMPETIPMIHQDILETLKAGNGYTIQDLRQFEIPRATMLLQQAGGVRTLLMTPMLDNGQLTGVLVLGSDEVREYSADEMSLVREVCDTVAIAFRNQRLLNAEKVALERERTLQSISADMTAGLDLDIVLERLLNQLGRVVWHSASAIILLADEGLQIAAARNLDQAFMQAEPARLAALPFVAEVLATKKPVLIPDTSRHPGWSSIAEEPRVRSWLGVPMLIKDQLIGMLALDRRGDFQPSLEALDAELTLGFANQAAVAIENARLFRQTEAYAAELETRVRRRNQQLQVFYAITALSGEDLEPQALIEGSLQAVQNGFPALGVTAHLFEGDRPELKALAGCLHPDAAEAMSRMLPGFLRGLSSTNPMEVRSATPAHLAEAGLLPWIDQFVATPMLVRDKPVGALCLFHNKDEEGGPAPLSNDDLTLISVAADQIAVEVENAALRRRIRQTAIMEERERMSRELHDVVTQSLYSIVLFTEAAKDQMIAGDQDAVERSLRSVAYGAQRAMGDMRTLMYDLQAGTLADKGLISALQDRLNRVERRLGYWVDLVDLGIDILPPDVEDSVYRVAMDSLNNVVRHAHTERVTVRVGMDGNHLVLTVADAGAGFDPVTRPPGMGLLNMRKRAELLGGQLDVISAPGIGTTICLRAPVRMTTDGTRANSRLNLNKEV